MSDWVVSIKRGSTFRVPISIVDASGAPTSFVDATFTITPEGGGTPIQLTTANGKISIAPFQWKERWWQETPYVINDVVIFKGKLWIAIQANTNHRPMSGQWWKLFSSFEFLIPDAETATYSWSKGTYKWRVVRTNGDVENDYLSGDVEVNA